MDYFYCPMCQRQILKSGKAIYVGYPTKFLICLDCWKGQIPKLTSDLFKVYRGNIVWKKQDKTLEQLIDKENNYE